MQRAPFLFLSGCRFDDTGGAQRPAQLARALASMGHTVGYHCRLEPVRRRVAGVDVLRDVDVVPWAQERRRGVIICSLAEYAYFARQLPAWTLVYDMLDDWDGFVAANDLHYGAVCGERDVVRDAALVTATAPRLVERALRMGASRVELVRNGGPAEALSRCESPCERIRVIYSGYLYGSWLDWGLLQAVAGDPRFNLTVVGRYDNAPSWATPGMFVGELPHAEALRLIAKHDVGIIPFRGELCRSVDPIKAYDYWAAGCWTVATDVLEPLRGRPYTVIAPGTPAAFRKAIVTAATHRATQQPDPDLVRGGSWESRARQILTLVAPSATERRPAQVSAPPTPSVTETRLRVTWEAPATCNMDPPCPYCNNAGSRRGLADLPRGCGYYAEGFVTLAKRHGPLYLSVCYGEPLSSPGCLRVVSYVARENRVDLVSNILAPVEVLDDLPRNGNVAIATSYHPHAWRSIDAFVAKREAIEESGIRCGIASIVAWPPHLPHLEGWCAELRDNGVEPSVLPFWGTFGGLVYPAAYTPEEWSLLESLGVAPPVRHLSSPEGRLCRAGVDYLFVSWDGSVRRCYHPRGQVLGSLFDECVEPFAAPRPCPATECPCPDMWQFREE